VSGFKVPQGDGDSVEVVERRSQRRSFQLAGFKDLGKIISRCLDLDHG